MNYRLLGRTGIRVSPLCFGAMSFGAEADEATSADLYKTVREAGINFIDCADGYTKGAAETILGSEIVGRIRDAGAPTSDDRTSAATVLSDGANANHEHFLPAQVHKYRKIVHRRLPGH